MPQLRVLGVLAGEDMPSVQLGYWLESADVVLAADAGADRVRELGRVPAATIGDLDSISALARSCQQELLHDPDQESTDCDKLLALADRLGHTEITLAGAEGDLLDHTIGVLQSAAKAKIRVRLALRRGIGWVLKGPVAMSRETTKGIRLSLIPITSCTGVALSGTQWELSEARLEPLGLTSLSNRIAADAISVRIESGIAFLFIETDGRPSW